MLIVRRRVGERIMVGGSIEIVVTAVSASSVRLGIVAPRGVLVLRGEVHDAVAAANAKAVTALVSDDASQTAPVIEEVP